MSPKRNSGQKQKKTWKTLKNIENNEKNIEQPWKSMKKLTNLKSLKTLKTLKIWITEQKVAVEMYWIIQKLGLQNWLVNQNCPPKLVKGTKNGFSFG